MDRFISQVKSLKMYRKTFIVLLLLLVCIVGGVVAKRVWDYRTSCALREYDNKAPLNIKTITSQNRTNYIREEFTFEGCPGEEVPVLALLPSDSTKRHPAIIFLYGIGMKMDFADRPEIGEAVTQAGFAMFIPEQFGRGKRRQKKVNHFEEWMALRRRIVLTVSETRRLADVVAKRPDIDPHRIYLWGASFGAMTGCAAMAYDSRMRVGVFTLSGGDLQKMAADSPYRKKLPRFSPAKVLAPVAASFLRPFDPIHRIGLIAPRPLLFQNMQNDDLIPKSAVDALYGAAGQPKQIIWYDGLHDHLPRETIEKVVLDALAWLRERDKEIIVR
ncbi:MAG: hypothetical protein PHR77_19305 [Kiritimatiellae bacterium]|nr:hypothetical protein [Kiritimatiellia bacterium]MDD5519726.1 hypothetical protein [Kiritimatiellia bacterium]